MNTKQILAFAFPLLIALNGCKKEDCDVTGDEDGNGLSDCADVEACGAEPQCQEDGTCAAPFTVADPSNGTAGDNTGATNQMDGSCQGTGGVDVVFSVTPTGNLLEVSLDSPTADLGVFVIPAASCAGDGSEAPDEIACKDAGFAGDIENLTANVTPGQEVLVIVGGFSADEAGAFTIDVSSRNVVCGDGFIDGAERCDDGNTTAGDGCDAACAEEGNFNCVGEPSVCTEIICGDGLVDFFTEDCDDGNLTPGDGCDGACIEEDGFNCTGEPSVCVPTCGDGFVDFDEECDDDNNNNGDGCAADCTVETNFACQNSPSVCLDITAECAAATAIVAGASAGDTSLGTASDKFEPLLCGAGASGGEDLFSFTATTASVTITVTPDDINGSYDPVVYVYLGSCAETNELACQDATFGGDPELLLVDGADGLPANGGALTIVVDSFSEGSEGAYTLTVVGL